MNKNFNTDRNIYNPYNISEINTKKIVIIDDRTNNKNILYLDDSNKKNNIQKLILRFKGVLIKGPLYENNHNNNPTSIKTIFKIDNKVKAFFNEIEQNTTYKNVIDNDITLCIQYSYNKPKIQILKGNGFGVISDLTIGTEYNITIIVKRLWTSVDNSNLIMYILRISDC